MEHNDKYLGKRLEGRYEIRELIGMGGMANVYMGYDTIDDRTVAIKILRDEYLGNEEFLRRFKNESKAIAVLSHPNIVKVYDVSFTNRVHSIIMEYIDGITLKDYIERQGVLTWKEAVHFTLQILRALQHAHERGIVHRDIKPPNIMLLQNGTIKVTDFGIARFARSEVQSITNRAIGSVHYISPEQAMGESTDDKTDIYSVGVMLFEMLTGRLPFEADSAVSVAIKQIQSQAAKPTELNPDIPRGLEDITIRAMQKSAGRRYHSAADMIADIERFKQDPSIQFEYKYMNNESDQSQRKKYRRVIAQAREDEPKERGRSHPVRRRRRTPYVPILTGVTFAFVLASIAFVGLMIWLNNPFAQVPAHPVPNLVGMKFDTAKEQYADLFELVQVSVAANGEYGKGVIFEQDPRENREVKEGGVVEVKVSSGQQIYQLQDFEGKAVEQVEQKLTELGLTFEQRSVYNEDIPAGSVVYTDPGKASQVSEGDHIILHVSLGPDEMWANVPSVKGLAVDRARRLLEMYNLQLGEVTEEDGDEPAGTIIAQEPEAGDLQLEQTVINVIVSRGEGGGSVRYSVTIPLPDVDFNVELVAYRNGEEVQRQTLNPRDVESGVWKPWFEGKDEIINIEITGNGVAFWTGQLDFSTGQFAQGRLDRRPRPGDPDYVLNQNDRPRDDEDE